MLTQFAALARRREDVAHAVKYTAEVVEPLVVELEFELFVERLGHFPVNALPQGQFGVQFGRGHRVCLSLADIGQDNGSAT